MSDKFTTYLPGTQIKISVNKQVSPLQLLLNVYRDYDLWQTHPELPTRSHIFRTIVATLWGNCKAYPFEWHPWAEEMSEKVHNFKYVGVAGCANSSKTTFAAVYGIVNWMCAPHDTLVLVTSTSLKDAQKRVWGSITQYYAALGGDRFFPGRLVQSQGIIKTDDQSGVFDERRAICLIAGAKDKEKESIGRLIGIKQRRIIFIADEMPELSEALLEAAKSNLDSNPDFQKFQMLGLGNLFSVTDPFGTFVRPKTGWENIGVELPGWETELGYCLHLDGMKSPNFEYDSDRWPFIYSRKSLKDHQARFGENSVSFWRMCRSFPPPVGAENTIYSDADFVMGRAMAKPEPWMFPPTKVAFLDPSYTSGGDRSAACFASYGQDINKNWIIAMDEIKVLHEDATKKDYPRNYQIADLFVAECQKRQVRPEHVGLDVTGGGREFSDRIADKWSSKIFALEFGGAPSMLPCEVNGHKTCKDAYDRKITEIWYSGLDFVRSGQTKGLSYDLMRELKARKYELTKHGGTIKVKVQPKDEMKQKIGFSPDLGDAWCGMVQLVRERLGARPSGGGKARSTRQQSWMSRAKELDAVHGTLYAEK